MCEFKRETYNGRQFCHKQKWRVKLLDVISFYQTLSIRESYLLLLTIWSLKTAKESQNLILMQQCKENYYIRSICKNEITEINPLWINEISTNRDSNLNFVEVTNFKFLFSKYNSKQNWNPTICLKVVGYLCSVQDLDHFLICPKSMPSHLWAI